jgi:hypothetical protein
VGDAGTIEGAPFFALNGDARASLQMIGGRLPVLIVDDFFKDPAAVRAAALRLPYHPPDYPYPGKLADLPGDERSRALFLGTILDLVNREYLPRIPPIAANGRPIRQFARVHSDFAITDVHPDELAETQRKPHTDPVPIFGLVYLNPEDRGGTLFFDRPTAQPRSDRRGYCASDDADFPFIGKIEGAFNRLAIYPGFVLHTGEIAGSWITGDERFSSPRLTQRFVFFP